METTHRKRDVECCDLVLVSDSTLPKADQMRVGKTLCVELADGSLVIIPKGFVTDLFSVPPWLHTLFKPYDNRINLAAVVHDYIRKNAYLVNMKTRKHNDLDGKVFGVQRVLSFDCSRRGLHFYKCECVQCGQEKSIPGSNLIRGRSTTCACQISERRSGTTWTGMADSRIGERHERLVITSYIKRKTSYKFICLCDCGNTTKALWHADLVHARVRSCGCLQREQSSILGSTVGMNNRFNGKDKYGWHHNGIYMRSGFEVMFAQALDLKGVSFQYEPTTFKLAFAVRYKPDFYVPSEKTYYEVKGEMTEEAQRKIDLFREMGHKLIVIGRKEIESMLGQTYYRFKLNWKRLTQVSSPPLTI